MQNFFLHMYNKPVNAIKGISKSAICCYRLLDILLILTVLWRSALYEEMQEVYACVCTVSLLHSEL